MPSKEIYYTLDVHLQFLNTSIELSQARIWYLGKIQQAIYFLSTDRT